MLRGSLHFIASSWHVVRFGFFSSMPRQKIVDALTGVISNQAVLPNRFCVSWPSSRNRWIGLFWSGTVDGRYLPCWDSCERTYGKFGVFSNLNWLAGCFLAISRYMSSLERVINQHELRIKSLIKANLSTTARTWNVRHVVTKNRNRHVVKTFYLNSCVFVGVNHCSHKTTRLSTLMSDLIRVREPMHFGSFWSKVVTFFSQESSQYIPKSSFSGRNFVYNKKPTTYQCLLEWGKAAICLQQHPCTTI